MEKKLIRSVDIYNKSLEDCIANFEVGELDVVAIVVEGGGVKIYRRAPDENSTPRKMEDRPMFYYHGYPFIITDSLK